MAKITRQELLELARISCVNVHEDEIDAMRAQLDAVLSYAERVTNIAADVEEPSNKAVNVFREDVVVRTNSELVLREAPQREDDYFVVPKIIQDGN